MSLQTALIVDDSKLARITLQRLLEKRNFEVRLAESATEALELLTRDKPDIIFMDHLMPEIDGFEAMRRIKADPATQHIPVVMCTGKEGTGDYDSEAKAIGAAATLSKPPELEQLNQVLEEAQQAVRATPATATGAPSATPTAVTPAAASDAALEERLMTALRASLDTLRHEAAEPIADIKRAQNEQNQIIEQKLEALWAALPAADTATTEAPQAPADSAALDALRGQLEAHVQALSTQLAQVTTGFDPLREQLGQAASRIEQLEQDSSQRAQLSTDADQAKTELAALRTELEQQGQRLAQALLTLAEGPESTEDAVSPEQLRRLQSALEQRLDEQQARLEAIQVNSQQDSPQAAQIAATEAEIRAALDQRMSALDQRLSAQLQALQERVSDVSAPSATPDEARLDALEQAVRATEANLREIQTSLRETETSLREAIGATTTTAEPGSLAEPDYATLERRATEAALTAVEETFDALIAHKVEQVRNNLALELKAQLLKPAEAPATSEAPVDSSQTTVTSATTADEVRRVAQEAVADELDQASAHLVAKITDALRERVEESQQELLARQEVFEQERGALRRQIHQLRRSLLVISTGAGLLAVVAFVTAVMT